MVQSPARGEARDTLLAVAAAHVAAQGAHALSVRAVAREAGVTHASATHHFGDRDGLLHALATQGFTLLADALEAAGGAPGGEQSARAYVEFALAHPGHFAVMFEGHLRAPADPAWREAAARAWRGLAGDTPAPQTGPALIARWSMVHGLAALWASGALPEEVTRRGAGAVASQVAKALNRSLDS
ncbi:TetR/AcrR family transcriptional regulator [Demequina sp. NBRC 110052]|uniref:TetR/AcrR family transcriptional regulator n=1 Tax=Demequina sp. NBRC 110052 TaxID=1570341 RepID=UPI0009FEA80D|nr:WHG domain-containing protein [Demequina sp. NBRC 110052]